MLKDVDFVQAVFRSFLRGASLLKPSAQNTILYHVLIEVKKSNKMPGIIQVNQLVFLDIAEQLKTILEENVFSSLLTRLMDVWEKGKMAPEYCSRLTKLCFHFGRTEQKITSLKLINQAMAGEGSSKVNLSSEAVLDLILATKGIRKADSLLNFHEQSFIFLSGFFSSEPLVARKVIDQDVLAILLTKMSDLLATKDFTHQAIIEYVNFAGLVLSFEETK